MESEKRENGGLGERESEGELGERLRPGQMAQDAGAYVRETASRDSFRFQFERLKSCQDALQTQLSHMTVARDRFQSEAEQLRATAAELTAAKCALEKLEREYARILSSRAERLRATAAELTAAKRALEKLKREYARILSSRSWRWTAPLRAVMGAWRRRG